MVSEVKKYEHIEELDTYFKEVGKYKKRLTQDEEAELSKRIQEGDEEAVNILVKHNLRFVVTIAKKYRSFTDVSFADLISEGNIGLIKAAYKFDPKRNKKFSSCAVWWIRSSINECIEQYKSKLNYTSVDDTSLSNLNIIDTSKTGYKLNYITDKNNVRLDDNFVVTENNELTGNYSKLTYKITFQVGENGTISTMEDGEVLSPVTVEYDDDYNLKIKANEGYKVNKVLVDGVEYQLTNGVLTIKNIKKDTNVVISFSLKTYNVKIDDKDYSFAYGTSYEDILKSINTNKDGYKFVGLKDKDGNLLDNNYKVKNNIELTTVFESIKKDSNNPYTVDSIVKYVLIFVVSAVLFTFVSYILLVKLKRKNG